MSQLSNKQIILGVSGGIAAYKAAELVRRLRDSGATVRVGLAAVEAIATTVGAMPGLKWPNDLLVEDGDPDGWKKVGGILGESFDDPRPVAVGRVAVLGIGINTGWDALRSDLPEATSLNLVTGVEVDRRELATALLARYRLWWQRLLDGDRAGFRAALEGASLTIGRRVRVELPTSEMTGVAEAITASGALIIVEDGGARREVTVGDVVHLRPLDDPQDPWSRGGSAGGFNRFKKGTGLCGDAWSCHWPEHGELCHQFVNRLTRVRSLSTE